MAGDRHYDAQLNLEHINTTSGALRAAAALYPEQTALQCGDLSLSYAQLDRVADRLASKIKQMLKQPGENIGFIGQNSAESVALMFGTMRAGAVWAPLNWRLTNDTLIKLIEEAGIQHVFTDGQIPLESMIGITLHNCTELLASQQSADDNVQARLEEPDTNSLALQIYTSGTSGLPKGVMLTHRALLASRQAERAVQQEWSQWLPGEINLVCMPNFHIAGVLSIFGGVCNLGHTILLPQFDPGAVLDVLRNTPPARLLLVPSAIKLLLDDPRSLDVDFSKIRYVFYGGSPMPEHLMREILTRMDCEFVQFYGMTETAGRATYLPPARHKDGPGQKLECAGQPFPGVDIQIRDTDGTILPAGKNGEICLRSPSLMQGYYKRPIESEAALKDGWYHTGDVGHLDQDNHLHIVDRLNDKIVTGGENVYPSEVESVLVTHPAIADAAVFGVTHPKWIEAIHAAIVLKPGMTVSAPELMEWAREKLGAIKSPKQIQFEESLPRGATGKVLRKELAASAHQSANTVSPQPT